MKQRGYYYEKPGWSFLPSATLELKEAEALMATKLFIGSVTKTLKLSLPPNIDPFKTKTFLP